MGVGEMSPTAFTAFLQENLTAAARAAVFIAHGAPPDAGGRGSKKARYWLL